LGGAVFNFLYEKNETVAGLILAIFLIIFFGIILPILIFA
jgi:hypothetical protein